MASEYEAELEPFGDVDDPAWSSTFEEHPHRRVEGDRRDVIPIAPYVDGIRFTRTVLVGHQDSVI
eukprot:2459335-Pyramimonas_sp.AAC.1